MSCLCLANLLQDDLISLPPKGLILQFAKLWETNHMAEAILSNVWHRSWTLKVEYMQCRWEIAPLWLNRIDCRFQRYCREKWESRRKKILSFLLLNPWLCLKFFLILSGIKCTHFLTSKLVLKEEGPVSLGAFVTFERLLNKELGFGFVRYFRSFCSCLEYGPGSKSVWMPTPWEVENNSAIFSVRWQDLLTLGRVTVYATNLQTLMIIWPSGTTSYS